MKNNNLIKKERIWYWDTVKFLMILFVVVGHVVGYIASYGREDVMAINIFFTQFICRCLFLFSACSIKKRIALEKYCSIFRRLFC